jgi:hypothetical protein
MSEALKIVTADDAALLKRSVARADEHGLNGKADPGRLVDLLEDIDSLKHEIHARMRRIETVKHAREILQEDALRTEALNRKLTELGRAMAGVNAPELLVVGDGAALPWHRSNELDDPDEPQGDQSQWNQGQSHALALELSQQVRQPTGESRSSLIASAEILEQAEQGRRQADQATAEARQMLDQWASEQAAARRIQDEAIATLQSARLESREAYDAASKRLEEAERSWKEAQYAIVEAQRLMDQSLSELAQARRDDQGAVADVESLRHELRTAHQSVSERSQEAARLWEQADHAVADSKHQWDLAVAEVAQARDRQETAAEEFALARQEVTTAYQFAAVAAQRQRFAEEFFTKAARWAVLASAVSWIAMVWFGWFAFRAVVPIWGAGVATGAIALVANLFAKKSVIEG